ncbi:hypothetical protein ABZX68_14695 [Streptomyces cellulosae]
MSGSGAAAGYDDGVDDVARVTYAEGGTAAALADGGIAMDAVLALEGMTAFAVPWGTVVAVVVGSAVVGVAAARLPALRASRMNVLEAIAHE